MKRYNKLIKCIALCTLICLMLGVLASCDILFSTGTNQGNNPSGNTGGGSQKPPAGGGSGTGDKEEEEEETIYFDKGIFFDSKAADDGDGSYDKPYNSLEVISELEVAPGAYIYLKRGSWFYGSLELKNIHGTDDEPIVVTAYGEGNDPKIDGNDLSGSGVIYIANCSNITVKNLEIFDSAITEADRRGVLITVDNNKGTKDMVTYKNIKLEKLYIHDILGFRDAENSGMSLNSKITGGIQIWSNDGKGRIDGLTITDCRITEVSNVGIASWYQIVENDDGTISALKKNPYSASFKDTAHLNVSIDNNEINFIGKNAIFVRHLYKGVIEHNVIHDTAIYCYSGNTIVTSYVDGTIIQYNEGYRNMARTNENTGKLQDGCMLDADLASKDTIWQYNYSHDNSFGLFINCTYNTDNNGHDKAIVRYNLSVNDKGNKGIIYINFESGGIYVYNNTIVTGFDTQYIIQSNSNRISFFYNNLIYNRSADAKFEVKSGCGMTAANNLIFNEYGSNIANIDYFKLINTNGIYDVDPLFIGYLTEDSVNGINYLNAYMLDSNSPALNVGYDVEAVPDFFGNAHKKSIGFYCGK